MSAYEVYTLSGAIEEFFKLTSATREACDEKAASLTGGTITPVPIQRSESYTVSGDDDFVVQFRLKQPPLNVETETLAHQVHGQLAPVATYHGELGDVNDRPVFIYKITRIPGISYIEFLLANKHDENSEESMAWREAFITDLAHFFATSFKTPQEMDLEVKHRLQETYSQELILLLNHLPDRFHVSIYQCLKSLPAIFTFVPTVLLHGDINFTNIIVDKTSCRLNGVLDWAEAEICLFGINLNDVHDFSGTLHHTHGRRQYDDHLALHGTFWTAFKNKVGHLSVGTVHAMAAARTLGLLRARGFTNRLASEPPPVPIRGDNEQGRYNMRLLDIYLVDPKTRFGDLGYLLGNVLSQDSI